MALARKKLFPVTWDRSVTDRFIQDRLYKNAPIWFRLTPPVLQKPYRFHIQGAQAADVVVYRKALVTKKMKFLCNGGGIEESALLLDFKGSLK